MRYGVRNLEATGEWAGSGGGERGGGGPTALPAQTLALRAPPPTADLREMYNATRAAGLGSEVRAWVAAAAPWMPTLTPPPPTHPPPHTSPQTKRRILMGTYALSAGYYDAYYKRAQQVC